MKKIPRAEISTIKQMLYPDQKKSPHEWNKKNLKRLKDLEEQIEETKLCTYKLIELISSYDKYEIQNKGVASESIDGYSVSYSTPNTSFTMAKNSEIEDTIKTYLVDCKLEDGTPYMYCGAK